MANRYSENNRLAKVLVTLLLAGSAIVTGIVIVAMTTQKAEALERIDYMCMQDCLNSGHQYGFCLNQCSYPSI